MELGRTFLIEYINILCLKLYNEKEINKQQAIEMMEINDENMFLKLYALYKKRFVKTCVTNIADDNFQLIG